MTALHSRKDESRCPIDNKILDCENDIFLDNFTKRQIEQMIKPCQNALFGCQKFVAPADMDEHLQACAFRERSASKLRCVFARCGCTFSTTTKEALEEHLKTEINDHLVVSVGCWGHQNQL